MLYTDIRFLRLKIQKYLLSSLHFHIHLALPVCELPTVNCVWLESHQFYFHHINSLFGMCVGYKWNQAGGSQQTTHTLAMWQWRGVCLSEQWEAGEGLGTITYTHPKL